MIYHVFANRSNIGDWLAAKGIQALLAPHPVTELLCDAPFVPATLAVLEKAGPRDLVVIGGGGLFMDYFEPFWEGLKGVADRVPFCIWGAGYCDLKREATRPSSALVQEVIRRSRLCIVRDELTRRLLDTPSLPEPVPCPSLVVVDPPEEPGYGLLHVDNYTTAGGDVFEQMDLHGRAFAEQTGCPYRRTNNRIEPGREDALAQVLRRYAQSDLILSSALHGCIIGVAMGRKVLAVSGDYKIEGFMEAVGLGNWVLDQDEVGALPAYLERVQEQPAVAERLDSARARLLETAQSVKALYQQVRRVAPEWST